MDTTSGLKVGNRDISGPIVCDGVPGSHWPVIESVEDVRLPTFEFILGFFFVVFVISCCTRLFYSALVAGFQRRINPEQQTEF